MDPVRITLISQPDCHLCVFAREVVDRVLVAGRNFCPLEYEELSLAEHPELAQRYAEYVPVVLVDGVQHAVFQVAEDRLAEAVVAAARSKRDSAAR